VFVRPVTPWEDPLSRTVFLHVGVAKTGTTYLQRLLFANRSLLRANGVLYPGDRPAAHFLASMDLREAGFGGHQYPGAAGMWDRITADANGYSGTTVISHETLARTRRKTIEHAVQGFKTDDVRVVLTTRDLGRQIPAVWQENVKNRNDQRYADFLQNVLVGVPPADPDKHDTALIRSTSFWRTQDLPALVKRWAGIVGPDKVVVVTVPLPGAERNELWRRFATAVGLPDVEYSFDLESENVSLGAAEAELLRRMIPHVPETVDWPQWETRVKRRFAERTLAPIRTAGKIVVPPRWHEDVAQTSERMIRRLEKLDVTVIGDLDDLRPRFEEPTGPLPDEVSEADLLRSAVSALSVVASTTPEPRRSITVASRSLADRIKEKLHRG
jgi:hypothetical protein